MKLAPTSLLIAVSLCGAVRAQSVSSPAILQMFEARWDMIENRMADIHQVGYGRMWVPSPAQASGGLSVGYDVFDRFNLGGPRAETRYGTDASFRALIADAHAAGVGINPELILNHNGVGNRTDANFVALGGYPGFALTLPGDINGDFHNPFIDFTQNELEGQLAGLNDIAQEKNYQFIRQPTGPGANNIPAGTLFNIPDPNNARFYPDLQLGGTTVFDARMNQNVTLYEFNAAEPLAGDPVSENALGLLMRNVRWMIQEYDIDGFRLDAARHFPRWVLDYFDQATFLAKREPLLDGSPDHVYSFIETGFDSASFLQEFIRHDINNANLGQVGGDRDALDFRLFNRLKDNLTGNGATNNWHGVRGASIDLNDDGLMNGSQGVSFVQSHDETGAFLSNVAHAYTLMLPGESLVYLNAEMDGPTGSFPQPGKVDALGGFYGETITTLVELRNTHGRGDFQERWIDEAFGDTNGDGQFSNVYIYERAASAIVGLNSRNDNFTETRNGVQTSFAPGTILVELTGNAADPTVDPSNSIPDSVLVDGAGQINVSIPANGGHGRGYVIYGVAAPQGTLSTGATSVLDGTMSTGGNFGTARLSDIDVVNTSSFTIRLDTTPVSLANPSGGAAVRDVHADGDTAIIKIDGGIDLNGNGVVDNVTPGSVAYGFEEFTTTRTPGYLFSDGSNVGTGSGVYEQTIDASALAEGRHYVTVRAFRHRNSATGGDGGPAVFTDFRRTIYVDLLPPDSEVVSFEPFSSDPNNPNNRDLVIRSVDQTADSVHVFLDLPANLTDAQVRQMVGSGNVANYYDRDAFIAGMFGVTSGNHAVTVVTYEPEPTGNSNVQRFGGVFTQTNIGLGLGDLNFNGSLQPADVAGPAGFEQLLYQQNAAFNPAADADGDGQISNLDLFALRDIYVAQATDPRVAQSVEAVLLRRANVNGDTVTSVADLAAISVGLGGDSWLLDIDANGVVEVADAMLLVSDLVRTVPGDYSLDGAVDAADYTVWRDHLGPASAFIGDGNFDGVTDASDLLIWKDAFGFVRSPLGASVAVSASVPEPSACLAALFSLAGLAYVQRRAK